MSEIKNLYGEQRNEQEGFKHVFEYLDGNLFDGQLNNKPIGLKIEESNSDDTFRGFTNYHLKGSVVTLKRNENVGEMMSVFAHELMHVFLHTFRLVNLENEYDE